MSSGLSGSLYFRLDSARWAVWSPLGCLLWGGKLCFYGWDVWPMGHKWGAWATHLLPFRRLAGAWSHGGQRLSMEWSRDVQSPQAGGSELAVSLSSHSFGHKASPDSGGGVKLYLLPKELRNPIEKRSSYKGGVENETMLATHHILHYGCAFVPYSKGKKLRSCVTF